ncbi:TonB-dependent receptor [Bacterioplanoides sp. SCSIO 12839]|uniref:TonB-dependent receptor n=1 Tax=Bacterioplanoides sp. SCSIO 12839 TaxID=2829569 RepID=UPI0021062FBB|nr:TonB-dependent receptor [Bacterioplanoides sp. SCSIO 12839]UTW48388.1 TonB-dependent receptor [Bacterioplanoides sp. SCSIO 12839]
MNYFLKPAFLLSPLALAMSLSAQAETVDLDTVTVSADFRQTDVQSIPEAVTVVTDTQIEQRSAEHLEQILSFAPNVNFSSGSSRGRYFQIRGIGERSQFIDPVNPSVGLMIDGIDMTGLGGAATLLDIEQVEILRGPQGTRFGANALAGMINIQSKAPTKETEGFVAAKAGNYGTHGQSGAISGGLTDNVQGRLAVSSFKTDGYMENDFLDKDNTNNIDEVVLRGKLAAQLSDKTDLNFTYFYTDIDNGYDAFSLDNNRITYSDNPGIDAQESHSFALELNSKLSDAVSFETSIATTKADVEYSYDEDWAFGQYTFLPDEPEYQADPCDTTQGPCLADFDGYSSFDQYLRDYQRDSLDLRLLSGENGRIFADTTDWVAGIYYFNRDESLKRNYTFADGQYRSDLVVSSLSLYGELNTQLNDRLNLIYGLRAEQWNNDFDDTNAIESDETETLWGGKATLEYLLDSANLVYGSLARGYKAGGVNTDPDISESNRTFDTEYNNTVELGLKSSLLDDKLQTRVATFYIQRKDQQVKSSYAVQNDDNSITFQDYLANAAEGKNYGLELEANWQATDKLAAQLSAGYLETEFVDYSFETDDGEFNKDGRAQAHAPEYSLAAAVNYRLTDQFSVVVENEAKDEFYFSDSHDEKSTSYVLWHARLVFAQGPFEASLYGRNLTDQDQEVRGFGGFGNDPRNGYADDRYVQLGEPRLVGIEGKYSF